jgi:uncharacterized protein YejL (UPF0352 family)
MDRIGKYKDLNKKYMELESRLTGIAKEESERKGFEAVKVELAFKKNEIKVIRIKLDKEHEKMKYLDEKLAVMEKHKDQIDANNVALNITNMLRIENVARQKIRAASAGDFFRCRLLASLESPPSN